MKIFRQVWYVKNLGLWLIIAINLLLLTAYFQDASNGKIAVIIFWIQSVLLGAENVLKMIFAKTGEDIMVNNKPSKTSITTNIGMAFFFCIHYGIFIIVFGLWGVLTSGLPAAGHKLALLYPAVILIAIGMVIELPSKLIAVRKKSPGIFNLMFVPYVRLIPFGLLILGDRYAVGFIIPLFILLKTGIDILYYYVVDKSLQNKAAMVV